MLRFTAFDACYAILETTKNKTQKKDLHNDANIYQIHQLSNTNAFHCRIQIFQVGQGFNLKIANHQTSFCTL